MERAKAPFLNPGLLFIALFAVYSLALFFLVLLVPGGWIQQFKETSSSGVSFLWRIFSVPLFANGTSLNFLGFSMEMTMECTAIYYLFIAVAAVLAITGHSFRDKTVGILFLAAAIFLLNAVRIGILGIIGRYANGMFDFVHTYLWQGMFALIVILLWLVWERGRKLLQRPLVSHVLTAFAGASVCFVCQVATLSVYASLLSAAATLLSKPVSFFTPVPLLIGARGNEIIYQFLDRTTSYYLSADIMNAMVLGALIAATADYRDVLTLSARAALGILMLFVVHVAYVMMFGALLASQIDEGKLSVILWIARGCSIAVPLLIWLVTLNIHTKRRFPSCFDDSHARRT